MTLSSLISLTSEEETPGIIIPEGTEDSEVTDISSLGLTTTLPKLKVWFLSEQTTLTAQITSNPTESGRIQNDNIILDPQTWNIKAKVTDILGASLSASSLVTALASTLGVDTSSLKNAGAGVSNSVYQYLVALRAKRRPFSIVTSFGTVKNLFFDSIEMNRDKDTANSLPFTMSLKELFISDEETEDTTGINASDDLSSLASSTTNLGTQSTGS